MFISMTGFGKALCEFSNKKITIEIRSLNSKTTDINTRLPGLYREREMDLRNIITKRLVRGKIDLSIYSEINGTESTSRINKGVVKSYYQQIQELAKELDFSDSDLLATIMRLPETLDTNKEELSKEEWKALVDAVNIALDQIIEFRTQEGKALYKDILKSVNAIQELIPEIEKFENERVERVKKQIQENLSSILEENKVDKNRFEQELIYYIEKFDINEEKVRLQNHCSYFIETAGDEGAVGKKLNFIAQEMGREINTLGSKANHHQIQKIVILMKEQLEQIKEQLLNVI